MIITTRRSRAGYLFDLLLTAGGWFAFAYLFGAGILAILRGAAGGPETSLWAVFLPTANTLWGYAALALANGAALVAWALYNHRRFAGKDRRRRAAAVGDAQLARSFTVAPAQLQQLRRARVAVIHHGDGGEIIGIEPARAQLRSVA
ncbi:poly-beta-1,6-N-acetyl-D-glucosamine biosynthesis protein PgaD [Achromobacter sp. AONIH1]|uniref:poly-beta-1,6-N-acetyl-D-glucosamine biosynthesis protein PgaD n=1 Tax=Achromobacter sp. AONIH1 TaxID=1758194 RepID=UPI000CD1BD37|nr:poly-beta-1,6-N-acetyl-D-glucosamine biosynthesis protein PgaD [Achromobacter sp. AONIH1]AUT47552.1 poly-beta-1,6-N-acetyl-D-glucosamine biosynthesis protein PgaD [Achromobacter sp. AONIH1]